MVSSKAKNPNCMYKWMDYIVSPKVNAQVAEWFGEAPSNAKSCAADGGQGPLRHVPRGRREVLRPGQLLDDAAKQCGDDRGDVCKDYSEWVQGWTEVKG